MIESFSLVDGLSGLANDWLCMNGENEMSTRVISVGFPRAAVFLTSALLLFGATGCYNQPVRHLAGDVILIKAGETTRQEAKSIMGEPDSTRKLSATAEEWLYQEEDKSLWQKTPLVGDSFSAKGYKTVALTVEGDVVTAARFGTYNKDEFAWKEDCRWQKIDGQIAEKSGSK